ncbi:hypothetical protein ACWCY6_40965 [Streptomyces sp. 900105755]
MSDTAALVAALADEDGHGTDERASTRRLRAWARIGEPELRRAGTLRGRKPNDLRTRKMEGQDDGVCTA